MSSSSFILRAVLAGVLPFIPTAISQHTPGATFFGGNGAVGAGAYQLVDDYESSAFFNKFTFDNVGDRLLTLSATQLTSNSHMTKHTATYSKLICRLNLQDSTLIKSRYVTKEVAVQNGYATVSTNNTAVISVETTNEWPNGGPGRPAVRLVSDNTYTHGLFIIDLKHMPFGCGTWPAYWLLGPNWPSHGEIDIIEGVNTIAQNGISMHTSDNCTIAGSGQTAQFTSNNCYEAVNGNTGCGSALNNTATPNNYGDALNNVGGGVYITEWTSSFVRHWFFPRNAIPASVTNGSPDTSTFGVPAVNAQGQCMIDDHFGNMSIIINTDFCGAYAGQVYQYYDSCPQTPGASSLDSCVNFVGNNPSYFLDAYWEINSIRVYQMPIGAQASSTYSTSLSSVLPSASTNTIQMGNAGSSSTVSSFSYTGPLSSITTTTASVSASATPLICPGSNNSIWTDTMGQQYNIGCGSDYSGGDGGLSAYPANSFEQCLEICDGLNGCLAAAYLGGNGAGVCYPKALDGIFEYNGGTNAGIRVAGPASASSSLAPTSMLQSSTMPSVAMSTSLAVPSTSSTPSPSSSVVDSMESAVSSSSPAQIVTTQSSILGSSSMPITAAPSSSLASSSVNAVSSSSTTATYVAPCPSSTGSICGNSNSQSTCSSPIGETYNVTCGIIYTGVVIDTSGGNKRKRATEPDLPTCQSLCDTTAMCVALNYINQDCELFSRVTGTTSYSGALGASRVVPSSSSSTSSSVATSSAVSMATGAPVCPGSAGKSYNDTSGVVYELGCYTDFAGNDIGTPISEPSFAACLPYCDSMSGCVGVEYNVAASLCYLKSAFTGTQTSDTLVIYGRIAGSPQGGFPVTQTVTPTTYTSLASGATVTVIPVTTVVSTVPPGGTFTSGPGGNSYIFSSAGSTTTVADPSGGGGSASLCYTCALTPTIITGGAGPADPRTGTCPSLPAASGTGTVTVYTTRTITTCGLPRTCPASGFVFGGGPSQASQSGQIVVTTTDNNGDPVTYTEIPTGPANPSGQSVITTTDGNGHLVTRTVTGSKTPVTVTTTNSNGVLTTYTTIPGSDETVVVTTNVDGQVITYTRTGTGSPTTQTASNTLPGGVTTALPTCPFSQGALYADSVGSVYQIACGVRYANGILETSSQSSFASCFAACDMYNTLTFFMSSQCLGVSFFIGSTVNNCMLVSDFTPTAASDYWSGRLTNPHYSSGNGNGTGPGGSTIYGTMTVPGGGGGTGTAGNGGGGGGQTYVVGGSTYYSTYATVGVTTIAEVSTYVSNGQTIVSTYGYTTGPGPTQYATATLVSGGSTVVSTAVATSYVPSTVYGVSTAYSTYVSNGITVVSTYGVTTEISISYVPASTQAVTTTTVSISISNQISTATVSGPTVTASGQDITVTGGGGSGQVTVTQAPSTVISYVYPSSSSSVFTCRTYATNYLNGMHGKKVKRSIFDSSERILEERDLVARPAARPMP